MRQFQTAALLLVISTITLSCGDADIQESVPVVDPVVELADHPRVLSDQNGIKISTLPIDDIAEHVKEMPDGIHLRPGVQIHQLDHVDMNDVEISRHSPIVRVTGDAIEDFAHVNPGDPIFLAEYAMIAESVSFEHGLITLEVSTFDLTRVIWGNFRIEYLIPMSPEDADAAIEPVIDALGNVTRSQAVGTTQVSESTSQGWEDPNDRWSFQMAGEVRLPLTLRGVFEGRIGSFNSSYDCRANASKSWYQRDDTFCVDRLAAWIEASVEGQGRVSATYREGVRFLRGGPPSGRDRNGRFFDRVLGTLPLGATGLFLELSAFGQYTITAEAGGEVTLNYTYNFSASAPFGFDYRNYPESHLQRNNGVRPIPNRDKPIQKTSESHTFNVTGALSASAGLKIEVGFMFGVSAARVAKIKGPYIAAVLDAQAFYKPFARDDNGDCAKLGVQFRGEAVARLEFEVDLKLWTWTTGFSCDNCTATFLPQNVMGPWASNQAPYCLDRPRYNRLVVDYVTGGPAGYEAPEGYLIDSIKVSRATPLGRPHTFYAIGGGGSGAHGPPNANSCPLTSGTVHPVMGRTEFRFSEDIRAGDRIEIVQSNVQAGGGLCRSGGRARFSLKGAAGASDVSFNNGGYYENAPTLNVPQ